MNVSVWLCICNGQLQQWYCEWWREFPPFKRIWSRPEQASFQVFAQLLLSLNRENSKRRKREWRKTNKIPSPSPDIYVCIDERRRCTIVFAVMLQIISIAVLLQQNKTKCKFDIAAPKMYVRNGQLDAACERVYLLFSRWNQFRFSFRADLCRSTAAASAAAAPYWEINYVRNSSTFILMDYLVHFSLGLRWYEIRVEHFYIHFWTRNINPMCFSLSLVFSFTVDRIKAHKLCDVR